MSNSRLDTVRETLEHELDLADAECHRIKAELGAAEKDRKAIRDALAALGRKPPKGSKKPAPKKEQVVRIIAKLIEVNGPMPQDDLEALVKDHLTEGGSSLDRLGLRFAEALKDERLSVAVSGEVSLATAAVGVG